MTSEPARVCFSDGQVRGRGKLYEIGYHVRLDYSALESFCWDNLSPVDVDLLVVMGAIAYADRAVVRRRARDWRRNIVLEVPVHDPRPWEDADAHLTHLLEWATGDAWRLAYTRRRRRDETALHLRLRQKAARTEAVIAYSGGLDSFAEAARARETEAAFPVLVTTRTRGVSPVCVPSGFDGRHARLPVKLKQPKRREPSYRSRQLLFFSAAAVAAKLRGVDRVIIGEPGQGAIGPSLVPFGNEHPYRGMHPGLSMRLGQMLKRLWGASPKFEHPNVWKTKAQLIQEAAESGTLDGWERTRSCAQHLSRTKGVGAVAGTAHCGICGGCMLRRMSIPAAGLRDNEPYFFHELGRQRLSLRPGMQGCAVTQTDVTTAVYAVLDLSFLAQMATRMETPAIAVAAHGVAEGLGLGSTQALAHLSELLGRHRTEWGAFLVDLPERSWVRRTVEGGDGSG